MRHDSIRFLFKSLDEISRVPMKRIIHSERHCLTGYKLNLTGYFKLLTITFDNSEYVESNLFEEKFRRHRDACSNASSEEEARARRSKSEKAKII